MGERKAGDVVNWKNARQAVTELFVNVAAPFLIYSYYDRSLGDVKALLASSAPPIAWSLFEFARKRRIDAVSLLVLGGIALSLLAIAGGGSVRAGVARRSPGNLAEFEGLRDDCVFAARCRV